MNDIIYLDTETTIHNTGDDAIGKMSASPWHPSNYVVYSGLLLEGSKTVQIIDGPCSPPPKETLLVAQNIAFDLEHLLMSSCRGLWLEWVRTGEIWDVQLAEYLLSGQESKWASLDELSMQYGGTVKDSRMKEYWKAGVSTEDIPRHEIIPYLEEDVRNLQIIYKEQMRWAVKMGMLPLLESQMEARLATIMMEYNGMYFNKKTAHTQAASLRVIYDDVESSVIDVMAATTPLPREQCTPNSTKILSALLFGGTVPVIEEQEQLDPETGDVITYKSGARKGQVKTKKVRVEHEIVGWFKPTKDKGGSGNYPVGDEDLKALLSKAEPAVRRPFINNILTMREYKKQISTYFEGYSRLVFPDGLIHGNLNHCQTNTGRLSSSQPNMQNVSGRSSSSD